MRPSEAETAHDSGQPSPGFQRTDLTKEFRYKSGISENKPLRIERVNEVTFKITDGELSRVPAVKGWWAGYNTTKARAWVINVRSAAWLARCGDHVAGPLSFSEAKTAAINLAKGHEGHYRIQNPISHLNGLQARLLDWGGAI